MRKRVVQAAVLGGVLTGIMLVLAGPGAGSAVAADVTVAAAAEPARLSLAEILDRHEAARGGVRAWQSVQALALRGKIEAGRGDNLARAQRVVTAGRRVGSKAGNSEVALASADLDAAKQVLLPFTLDLQRPNRMRLELQFDGKTAVQVFDGQQGWKYRPFLNRADAEPYTPEEVAAEAGRTDFDGPLINRVAKGTTVVLDGTDLVEGQPAYRLRVTPRGGAERRVWIDARSFLDVKVEGLPRRVDGAVHPVFIYQRDFRAVQGVVLPFVVETAVEGAPDTHKLLVEQGTVNPHVDATRFGKPGV